MQISDLLNKDCVSLLDSLPDKTAVINHLVDLVASSGCLCDKEKFRQDVFAREAQGSTGFGEGVAIPHAKSDGVARPGLAALVVKSGVDFDAFDGQKVELFFIIASPHQASDAHLDVLARLSTLLMDESLRQKLKQAQSADDLLAMIDNAERAHMAQEAQAQEVATAEQSAGQSAAAQISSGDDNAAAYYDLVAVTACPAGLSHTYMAAEALEQKARELGIKIKVEADGAAGNRNRLLPEDIAHAKAVIVAADRAVEMDRFIGKPMVRVGVGEGVHHPEKLIQRALSSKCPVYRAGGMLETSSVPMRLYRHLMSGLTYLLPVAATAGIVSAVARLDVLKDSSTGLFLDTIGYSLGTLLFPILSAFIAFSIAGRTSLVAGFTGGVMADMAGAGVVGALLNGFIGGGAAFLLTKIAARFLKGHDAMFALLVYPLLGATITTVFAQYVTSLPAAFIDNWIENFIINAPLPILMVLGAVLAGMMSADMGGPFNKVAYATGVLLLADCLPENGPGSMVMAAVMAGGMVPPLAAALASGLLGRHYFSKEERKHSAAAAIKGLMFITEGVLPFLIAKRMRLACILGSAVAGALATGLHCGLCAPHGGIFIVPLAQNPLGYLFALAMGTLMGALCFVFFRRQLHHVAKRSKGQEPPLSAA